MIAESPTWLQTLPPPPVEARGLSSDQVHARLRQYGPNALTRPERTGVLRELLRGLRSPLMLILLAASALAAFVGETTDATIIAVTVLLGAALDAFQTSRSTAAVERLRQSVVPTATVWRDDQWREIARADLVPGDTIHLSAGDVVPADAWLISTRDLHVQQAALTGESFPAEKQESPTTPRIARSEIPTDPSSNDAVFLGTSVVSGVAVAVVAATGSRTAFGEIAARLSAAPPPTAIEVGLRRFGGLLARTVIFLVLFLVLVSVALHRDPLESLLFASALAVGVIPEFMPMVTSITLATGAVRMARRHVVVKHLAAIHNFGSVDVLCCDKTGTLTRGQMRLDAAIDVRGAPNDDVLHSASLAAHFQTGIQNPLDDAILAAGPAPRGWSKVDEVPFDFERRRMSIVVARDGEFTLIAKGAPEQLLSVCSTVAEGDRSAPLDEASRGAALDLVRQNGARGLRTLGIATRKVPRREAYGRDDETDLSLLGWLTFSDPPLEDTATMVDQLARDGVLVKILTGDDHAVACHVCDATGIDTSRSASGTDVDRATDPALGVLAERTTLFTRVTPQQKLRIILALKGRGHVVGYIGDGINDAPSLHAADVGISVSGAVDVAKDAADIILLDRGLGVVHAGIVEGRKAFGNVMKYLLMGTSSNFGNMFSMAVASLIVPFLPMLPTQILLNNFLYDLSQVAIPSDTVDDVYIRKPHHWDMGVLRQFMIRIGLVSSVFDLLTFAVLLLLFRAPPAVFRTGWFIESIVTQTLVLFVIRTTGNPFKSRPSGLLAATISATVITGILLPFSPARHALGFVVPPPAFLAFVLGATILYLFAVQLAKMRLVPRLLA